MDAIRRILIVDTDADRRAALVRLVGANGALQPREAGNLAQAVSQLMSRDTPIDAVISSAVLHDRNWGSVCTSLRHVAPRVPILLVADTASESEIVEALGAGANDVVSDLSRPAELRARLSAHIRNHEALEEPVLIIGPYQFRPAQRLMEDLSSKRRIRLTDKETAILKYLYGTTDTPVSRSTLLRDVWGYSNGTSTHTVETHVYRLRRKIAPNSTEFQPLVNLDGGYRLVGTQSDTPAIQPWPDSDRARPGGGRPPRMLAAASAAS